MKRVKIMLTAIVVMAVVAGAFAFRVKKTDFCFFTLQSSPKTCVLVGNAKLTGLGSGNPTVGTVIDKPATADACSDIPTAEYPATAACNSATRTTVEN